jgi:hypothetical protein
MVSTGAETNEREPNRAPHRGSPTGAIRDSAEGHSIPQTGSPTSRPADIVMMDAASLENYTFAKSMHCVESERISRPYRESQSRLMPSSHQDRPGLGVSAMPAAHGESMGPLHGFPHAVKDMQPVKGIRSTSGSPILKDFVPTADSLMVERLRKAGAIIRQNPYSRVRSGITHYNPVYGRHATPMINAFSRRQQRRCRCGARSSYVARCRRLRLWRQPAQSGWLEQRFWFPY